MPRCVPSPNTDRPVRPRASPWPGRHWPSRWRVSSTSAPTESWKGSAPVRPGVVGGHLSNPGGGETLPSSWLYRSGIPLRDRLAGPAWGRGREQATGAPPLARRSPPKNLRHKTASRGGPISQNCARRGPRRAKARRPRERRVLVWSARARENSLFGLHPLPPAASYCWVTGGGMRPHAGMPSQSSFVARGESPVPSGRMTRTSLCRMLSGEEAAALGTQVRGQRASLP